MNREHPADAIAPASITGLVLAGGRGARMGGVDKGLVLLGGQPLVEHALNRLRPQVGSLMINANRHLDAYRAFGVPVCSDLAPAQYAGPLAGFAAGLACCETPWLLTVPCDCPLFPHDLAARLAQAVRDAGADIAVARAGGRRQPVFCLMNAGVYAGMHAGMHTGVRADLDGFMASGGAKVDAWIARHAAVEVEFPDPLAFVNVNEPDELGRLEQRLQSRSRT